MALSREGFRSHAQPIPVKVGEQVLYAEPKEFSTGSVGWFLTGKLMMPVNGEVVKVQVGCNMTVVGSKELPK